MLIKSILKKAFSDSVSQNVMKEVFNTKPEKQLEYLRKRGANLKTTVNWESMNSKAHAQAFTVAGIHKADILKIIYDRLDDAKSNGKTLKQFLNDSEEIKKITGLSNNRLKVIYETNLGIAYAKGQYEQQQRLGEAGVRPFLKYISSTSSEKDELHKSFYGKVFRYDDPFWKSFYPPSRFGCKCSVLSMSQKEVEKNKIDIENGKRLLNDLSKDSKLKLQINNTVENGIKIEESFKPNLDKYIEKHSKFLKEQFSKMVFIEKSTDDYSIEYSKYYKKLPEDVKVSLNGYKGKGFEDINKYLRGEKVNNPERVKKTIDEIIDGDMDFELEQSTIVYRGTRFDDTKTNIFNSQLEMIRSKKYTDSSFVSASVEEKIGNMYGHSYSDIEDTIFFTIKLPKGSKVGLGQFKESEYILKPNSSFKVLDYYIDSKRNSKDKKIVYVSMVYVP